MNRSLSVAILSMLLSPLALSIAYAQSLDKLNLQFHGYATDAFIHTNQNNWNTTDSTGNGSFRWTEEVASITARPTSRLRLGAQSRLYLLGTYGPKITFDWASAEFKFNERFGVRAGKVKSPSGLFNEIQDIDPAYLWVLLPQSIYPLASRNGNLSVRGGVVFGTLPLGERLGKIEYRSFLGERVLASDDGYFSGPQGGGTAFPHGTHGRAFGATLTWKTPLPGLLVAVADGHDQLSGDVTAGPLAGPVTANPGRLVLSGRYERSKLMVAGEYTRFALNAQILFAGLPFPVTISQDQRSFYVMTSYKLARKLTAGAYYSSVFDIKKSFVDYRYQKDWTVSGRYDFDSYLYLKLEQHFLDGTLTGFDTSNNLSGLQETSRLSLAKLGVTF